MPDTKISALTDGVTANSTDRIPVARAGANDYITPGYLQTFLGFSSGILATANGGTASAFFTVAGPSVARVYTFPDAAATILYSGGALGTPSSGTATNITGLPEGGLSLTDITTANSATTQHGFLKKLSNVASQYMDGTGNWSVPAGGAALSGISAATGANTIASGNNTGQVWNWANTTDATVAFKFGETSAATNGTATSGVPNQVLVRFATLAASTQSPFQVYVRGVHALSFDATNPQLLAANGTNSLPSYSFASATGGGFFTDGTNMFINSGAATKILSIMNAGQIRVFNPGTVTLPTYTDYSNFTSGWSMGANIITANDSTDGEWMRFLSRAMQMSRGSADATGYAMNFRKARGTVAAPTVITTGDAAYTESGVYYVGATNAYVTATTITSLSEGTIADTTTGVGGVLQFNTMAVGSAIAERGRMDSKGNFVWNTAAIATNATDGFIYVPTCAGAATGTATTYTGRSALVFDTTNNKLWINNAGTWKGVVLA